MSQTDNEAAILSNQYGSPRYIQFLENLGHVIRLKDCSPESTYLGGLDTKGNDGQIAYTWQDEVIQSICIVFVFIHTLWCIPKAIAFLGFALLQSLGSTYIIHINHNITKSYKVSDCSQIYQ